MAIRTYLIRKSVQGPSNAGAGSGTYTYSVSLGLDDEGRFELTEREYFLEPHNLESRKATVFGGTYTETDAEIVCVSDVMVTEKRSSVPIFEPEREFETRSSMKSTSSERRFSFKKSGATALICAVDYAGLLGGEMKLVAE